MQSKQFTAALALLAAPALSFGQAKEAPAAPKAHSSQAAAQELKSPAFASASELIGKDVLTRAASDGKRKDIGDVRDFVVDGTTGAVTQVVISSGGVGTLGDTLRLRPFSELRFDRADPKAPKIWLDVTEADFEASAKLTKEAFDAYGCKALAEAHVAHQAKVHEAGTKTKSKDGQIADGHMSTLMLASELDDFDVRTMASKVAETDESMAGESLGSVHEAWIDCAAGKVAYLTLQHNKRSVVLPMAALVVAADTEKKTLFYETPCTVVQLAAAPALDEKANLTLENADFRKSVAAYYAGLEPTPIGEGSAVSANSSGRE